MTEEQIVDKVSEIMDMRFSHYDNHKMGLDYLPHVDKLKSIPKIVQYTGRYGPWGFAILEDMSVVTAMSQFNKIFLEISDSVKDIEGIDTSTSDSMKKTMDEMGKIKKAEKFLKENKCVEVINNPDKKINWV